MKHLTDFEFFTLFESSLVAESDLNYAPNGPIRWDSVKKTFSVYASDAGIGSPGKEVSLSYQGKTINFKQSKVDMDGSGEDIYGWWYDSTTGSKFPCKLLIIND